jgi:hypothetical protein
LIFNLYLNKNISESNLYSRPLLKPKTVLAFTRIRTFKLTLLAFLSLVEIANAQLKLPENLQWDIIGDSHHSHYNFTDAVFPYYGMDSWIENKFAYWLDEKRSIAPFASVLFSNMFYLPGTRNEEIMPFFWQDFMQGSLGMQWHFLVDGVEYSPKYGLRAYLLASYRWYYNKLEDELEFTSLENHDFQLGIDFYYDNLFIDCDTENAEGCRKNWILIAWANLALRNTNFNQKKYNTVLAALNVKLGKPLYLIKHTYIFPYITVDATATPLCKECKWRENFVHAGGGIRWYPFAYKKDGEKSAGFWRRFHVYGEFLWEGLWLKPLDELTDWRMKDYDMRFGFGFSTPGFNRSKKEEANQ